MVKIYYKNIYISKSFLRLSKLNINVKHFRTHKRCVLVLPLFLWRIIEVYNGKKYIPVNVDKRKVGFLLKYFLFNRKKKLLFKEFNIKII